MAELQIPNITMLVSRDKSRTQSSVEGADFGMLNFKHKRKIHLSLSAKG